MQFVNIAADAVALFSVAFVYFVYVKEGRVNKLTTLAATLATGSLACAAITSMAYVCAAPVTTSLVVRDAPPTGNFYLKTVLSYPKTADAGQKEFANLFVAPYHIGAGWNDVALQPKPSVPAYMNGTNIQFAMTGKQPFTYSLIMPLGITGAMQPVMINADFKPPVEENHDFEFVEEDGLRYDSHGQDNFSGWLACIGTHNIPQLFWQAMSQRGLDNKCVEVNLLPEKA